MGVESLCRRVGRPCASGSFRAQGSPEAFAELLRRHAAMVRANVHASPGPDTADADDAFQVVFLVLVRRASSIRQRETARSWLYAAVDARKALELRERPAKSANAW